MSSSSLSPPTSSSSSISTAPTMVESTIIQEDNHQALLNWASSDDDIKKLIQKEHIPGRVDQAINFANFMQSFEENPDAKERFRTKDNFYAVLREKYTSKREDTGFSSSSCKRLKVEGDCYISLQKANLRKFPQAQNVAIALKNCATPQNIGDIWNVALGLYDGDEKCILKRDISVALEIYNQNQIAAPVPAPVPDPQLALLQQQIQDLQTQLAAAVPDPAPEIVNLRQQIQDLQTQLAAPAAVPVPVPVPAPVPSPELDRLQQRVIELEAQIAVPPQVVLFKTQKKLEYADRCLNDIDRMSILAFYKKTEDARFTEVSSLEELQDLFKENKTRSDQGQPPKYEIGVYHDEDVQHIVLKDLPHWRSIVWRHFKKLVEKTKESIDKKMGLCDELDDESDNESDNESDSNSNNDDNS